MKQKRVREQHIAVFGESGSGKTVLVSSFYGAAMQPEAKNLYEVVADSVGQGNQLYKNYLGMKKSATVPAATRFASTTYSFAVNLKDGSDPKYAKARPFDALRLVWHDYPGEWFESDVSGPEEMRRKAETFKNLLSSDVAILMVDGQLLLDNEGEEERYLKSLLTNVRTGIASIKSALLEDGKPLVQFPRIWMIALSKADLLPELDVLEFRDLMIHKVGDEVGELHALLASFVEDQDRLSVGEDFVLLSSAEFSPNEIEVTKTVGLNLILPLASMLPFERHLRWAQSRQNKGKVAEVLLEGAGGLANALGGVGALAESLLGRKNKLLGSIGVLLSHFGSNLADAAKFGGEKLKEANLEAVALKDNMRATLTSFQLDLKQGEQDKVLLRSNR